MRIWAAGLARHDRMFGATGWQTDGMRVLLKLELDCTPSAAWRAVQSPAALGEIHGPLIRIEPLSALPTQWEPGRDAAIRYAVGPIRLGSHLIRIAHRDERDSSGRVRIFRDWGDALTGPLALLDAWDHQMAVSPSPRDESKTLWRERLVFTGAAAPFYWPALWLLWQWRAAHLKRLAPTWEHDPAVRG
ncbi:hypothetical protein [Microbacterium sp. JB110]|uniref:hypothetical protein n=1 Tax=Microbacterium sp. JB110 TaxID=2024477 RepID=UPI00097F4236|nr:hypothetical protein [Microbacterium sp. JB110]SJM55639.1 hypothetical protein CZ774_07450 [Frigoribacterium sp. JB110]